MSTRSALHVFDTELAGGRPALALIVPYVNADMDLLAAVDANAPATLATSRGREFTLADNVSRNGTASFGTGNIGDTILGGLVGWQVMPCS